MVIGVLAFQGDFAEHIAMLHSLHTPAVDVRSIADLTKCSALIIPGGESTVMAKFLRETGVGKEIAHRVRFESFPVYGTCAGAILLARKATGKNAPKTLGLIDIVIDRNAYGAQRESFEAALKLTGLTKPLPVSFIRAPKITKVGRDVEVLAEYDGEPVLVRQGSVLAGTFHAELCNNAELHRYFLTSVVQR